MCCRVEANEKRVDGCLRKESIKRPRNTETSNHEKLLNRVNMKKTGSKKDAAKEKEKISLTLFHE